MKIAYVNGYQVGEKVEIPVAEKLLSGYNDFYESNLEFYQGRMKQHDAVENEVVSAEDEQNEIDSQVEKQVNDEVQAFSKLWGSMDFATATLVGLDIDWDSIQEKVMHEQEKNILPSASKLTDTACQLRKIASVLAFSERIVTRLHRKAVDQEMIDLMVQGFETLLAQVVNRNIDIPELDGAESKKIIKLKTVDAILDYANNLFVLGR
ncbi:MAG: hypothetical protein MJ054_00460 [Clostridia bacterium]|nr:hypothetical protein [Clostridia bacterium]